MSEHATLPGLPGSGRPLIVTDCDEVLLHMAAPFRDWLAEHHGVCFALNKGDFASAMSWAKDGALLDPADMWRLLGLFFDTEMTRQTPIAGAVAAMRRLSGEADIVVLTNLQDHRAEARARQLASHGLKLRVVTNQGPKGPALAALLAEYQPSRAVFIDDLAQHHRSVGEVSPATGRLHLCGEPELAPYIACALATGHAHARIDDWSQALPWLLTRLHGDSDGNAAGATHHPTRTDA